MKKQYLTEYLISNNVKFKSGEINMINTPCGSGKTTFIFSKEGIVNNYKKFTDSEYDIRPDEVLYVVDTSMLKENILKKYKHITKKLETNDFYKYLSDDGIAVLTYAQLGNILCSNEKSELINTYKLIIFDEFHNLFYYNNFNSSIYGSIIKNLNLLSKKSILLALTATPYYMEKWNKNAGLIINDIIEDKNKLVCYGEKEVYKENHIENYLKLSLLLNSKNKKSKKILIYTRNISIMKKYKKICELNGLKAEMLWSINSKEELSKNQIDLRKRLIEKGTLPEELSVLILNESMATGWSLIDKKVQTIIIDSTNQTMQIQVRNRIRNNIEQLILKKKEDNNIKRHTDNRLKILMNNIDPKYLNKKLTKEDKEELVLRYTYNLGYNKLRFINFKEQFNKLNIKYEVFGESKGTYIKKKGSVVKNKVKARKNNNINLVKEWLTTEWDKKEVPVNEVKDILGLGRRVYEKVIKDDDFTEWLDNNNIEMTRIKGLGKTIYFNIKQ